MNRYVIELYSLGHLEPGEPATHDFDVQAFIAINSIERLRYNLDNLYAVVPLVDADGPAIGIKWQES